MRTTVKLVSVAMLLAASTVMAQGSTGGDKPKPAQAAQPEVKKLGIGDKAPALTVSKWVKGEPITGFEKGRVYVIDCWATWCGPCIAAIPHMTETQHKYKDKGVSIIGVSMWEADSGKVDPFVTDKGEDMDYRVATDDVPALPDGVKVGTREAQRHAIDKGKMSSNWMKAAGRNGIPNIFIVDQEGRIAWIGHPMAGMDEALEQIVAGKWDIKKAADDFNKKQGAAAAQNEAQAKLAQYRRALAGGKTEEASKVGRELVASAKGDAMTLNQVAWFMVDPAGNVENKDLDLAHEAATKACEATKWEDGTILDTLALVEFLRGNVDKAIELQTKAVKLVGDENAEMKAELEGRLAQFKAAKK